MNDIEKHCPEIREKLPLYIGGDLDPEVLESVRTHLASCGECALRTGEASRARQLFVGALQEAELRPAELWSGLREVLSSEGRIRTTSGPIPMRTSDERGRPRLRLVRYAGALAAAAAVVLFASAPTFRRSPALEIRDTSPDAIVARPVASQPGMLQRVAPEEERPLGEAREFRVVERTLPPVLPVNGAGSGEQLAGYK